MSRSLGNLIEARAKTFLEQQGCRILAQNFTALQGEIDLICTHQNHIVFVEVRYRSSNTYANSLESISPHKQKLLIRTAQCYLQRHRLSDRYPCRFDVICVDHHPNAPIDWIQQAFDSAY